MRCSKCKCDAKDGTIMSEGCESFKFCRFCSVLIDKMGQTGILKSFLHKDASENEHLNLTNVERDMLKARENRSSGVSVWKSA